MNYVIIGNAAAAVGCIEGIRQIDKTGPITVISKENHHTYSRPLISYLLYGKTDEQRMKYRPDSFYKDNKVDFLPGKTAVEIDPDKKTVLVDDGSRISYDKLLVATGSSPFVPPIEGLDKVNRRFSFMTLDDAKAIQKAVTKDTRVMILGAGLIGLKCAEGLADRVGSITVVDLADRILPSVLDVESAHLVQRHLEEHGLKLILSDSAQSFGADYALLKSGKKVEFDILVTAVGVRANTGIAAKAGCEVKRGISTDRYCRTTVPDIYAAGDCSESFDVSSNQERVLAILPNAYMQGECAGIHMAGGDKPYDNAIPMNSVGFFGLHVITAGSYDGENYVTENVKDKTYKKLVTHDGLLKGYILVGDVARAGIYTSLIRKETPLDTIDFDLIKERPQLMAFSKTERQKMLSGAK